MAGSRTSALVAISLIMLAAVSILPLRVQAHEEEGSGIWLLSYAVDGNLQIAADASLSQWSGARMIALEGMNTSDVMLMSVHNSTFVVFLLQATYDVSTPYEDAGAVVAFEKASANDTDLVWGWRATEGVLTADPGVTAEASLDGSELSVVFGRLLNSSGSPLVLQSGVQYMEFVKVAVWNKGQSVEAVNLEELTHLNLELLPRLDVYPKWPLVYSSILVAGVFFFIYIEIRRYEVQTR